jgi:CcmD family protein
MTKTRWLAVISAILTFVWGPTVALAQVFEKVEGGAKQEVPAVPFVSIAYGIIWILVLSYVVVVAKGVGRVNKEIDDLERKLGGAPRK